MSVFVLATCLLTLATAAPSATPPAAPAMTPEQQEQAKQWLEKLYELGVREEGDSLYISGASRRALTDTAFRRIVYPETYGWGPVTPLIEQKQYKIAFWYLINLYEEDKEHRDLAVSTLATCDQVFDMEKALVAAFYTYGVFDPRVCTVVDGHPQVTRPDLVERRLGTVREINGRILAQRKLRTSRSDGSNGAAPPGGKP